MDEEWRPVVGYEGLYDVSSLGRVRRLRFTNRRCDRLLAMPRVQCLGMTTRGYLNASLWRGGHRTLVGVHRLVLFAFAGPCPPSMEAAHNNGDKTDNRASNLRWDTRSGNHADKWRHGTAQVGTRNPWCKFSKQDVALVRRLHADGVRNFEIAKRIGSCQTTVGQILSGQTRVYG